MNGRAYVAGYCPMGCGWTLGRTYGGHITCGSPSCPRPDAVATLLEDRETEHIVQFDTETFTIRHPLRERLDDALMECQLHTYIQGLAGPPVRPGRYRSRADGDRWTWEALDGEEASDG